MKDPKQEIQELRAGVSCATVLEKATPPWRLDRAESSQRCLKYRRGAGEVVIVIHDGAGWWDPNSDAKGDVFSLIQHLDPRLNFGDARKALRPLAGVQPDFTPTAANRPRRDPAQPIAKRWALRPRLRKHSNAWRYLASRGLPEDILFEAARCDVIREGPHGSAWFAHRDAEGAVSHVDVRGPTFKGSLTGGHKSLFVFPDDDKRPRPRFVLAEAPIDALSRAAIEAFRADTIYAATGGGMSPATIEAISERLRAIKPLRNAHVVSATDANLAGDRYAARHEKLAKSADVPFVRLRPPREDQDWNDVLKANAEPAARRKA